MPIANRITLADSNKTETLKIKDPNSALSYFSSPVLIEPEAEPVFDAN